jgi:pimeloyl-ACP methyl ester carboxylesterase
MDLLEKKTLRIKRSLTYTYYVSAKGDATKPALFFIHGFPDSAYMWSDVVDQLADLPYKVIVPDTLGYAGSSKPTDTSLYNYARMAEDMVEILQAEDIARVIIIGHDWGSGLAQRFYLHHPEFVEGIALLNVSYLPPREEKFDLDAVNAFTEKVFGYPQFAYWEFFTADDAAEIVNNNLDKFWEVLHGDVDDWMKKMFCVRGAMRDYLLGDKHVPLKSYAREGRWKDDFMGRLMKDGFEAPFQWYKASVNNVQWESDRTIPKEVVTVRVPMLYIGCTGDSVCRSDMIEIPRKAGLLPDLEVQSIESGHWCAMEKPDEVAKHIRSFVTRRFP